MSAETLKITLAEPFGWRIVTANGYTVRGGYHSLQDAERELDEMRTREAEEDPED